MPNCRRTIPARSVSGVAFSVNTPRCEKRDVPDDAYFDGRIANMAVKALRELKGKRFFLGCLDVLPRGRFDSPRV